MPKSHVETITGPGDQSWLASDHGLFNARSFTLHAEAFKAVQDKNGKVPSGYPVAESDGKLVPYAGSGTFVGHNLFDQDARYGDIAVAVLYHGTVNADRVPVENFKAPSAQPKSSIIFL